VAPKTTRNNAAPAIQTVPPVEGTQQDKRDRIIERAILMFNGLGYDRVRVSDITESLNMGKGTFYLCFRNKKDLLLSCFDHVDELILELESRPAIREGDFFAKVGPRVESIGQRDWFPGLVNLLRAAELSPDAEVQTKAREAYECIAANLRRDLEAAIQAGGARDVDADLAAYGFIGMAENLWFRSRLDDRYAPEQIVAFMAEETRHWLSLETRPRGRQRPATEQVVRLICRDGNQFELSDVRYNGEPTLDASLGQAQIDLEPSRLESLVMLESDEQCLAQLIATDGTEMQVRIDGSAIVSGDTPVGTVRVTIRDASSLTWGD
jgi:AcrR family transcriptional regulator